MKRFLKALLLVVVIVLLLPFTFILSLHLYGKYLVHTAEERQAAVSEQMRQAATAGNGFGGDIGIDVSDSGYRSELFFWIDDTSLVFRADPDVNEPHKPVGYFVWNTQTQSIKRLNIPGRAIGYYDGTLAEGRFSDTAINPDGSRQVDIFRSKLRESNEEWVLENTQRLEDTLEPPPDRYELTWVEGGKPWYRLNESLRVANDPPAHRFDYLWEWGWILRSPYPHIEHIGQSNPAMGVIDIGGQIYADQPGRKVVEFGEVSLQDLHSLKAVYVDFLDRFWIADNYFVGDTKKKFMGFLARDGVFRRVDWPSHWRDYMFTPLPTRKGLFWFGPDYRFEQPADRNSGIFLLGSDGKVSKLVHGSASKAVVSSDGCRVAFYNVPRIDRPGARLRVVNVCTSTMDGRVLNDVEYRLE